jgi:hypothetical protein
MKIEAAVCMHLALKLKKKRYGRRTPPTPAASPVDDKKKAAKTDEHPFPLGSMSTVVLSNLSPYPDREVGVKILTVSLFKLILAFWRERRGTRGRYKVQSLHWYPYVECCKEDGNLCRQFNI